MRAWTKSACVVLAWSILPIVLVAVAIKGSVPLAQANTRIASSTEIILTSTLSVATAPVTATHTTRYVVRSGDTLSAIAARFAVRGGWPALYAANRQAIGPDPNVIHSGTVLVLPGLTVPTHYSVAAGDTLSGIAAEFAVRGGWPALYAANRQVIGPDPGVVHPGTVLTLPRPAAASPSRPGRGFRRQHLPSPPPSPQAGPRHHRLPVPARVPHVTGMPQWLKAVLVAVGLLILGAFLAEPVLVVRGRQRAAAQRAARAAAAREAAARAAAPEVVARGTAARQAAVQQAVARQAAAREAAAREAAAREAAAREAAAREAAAQAVEPGTADFGPGPACWRASAVRALIVVADYHRLVVTRSKPDDTVYVLRPPGEDPRAILRVARLVLPEGPYAELAKQLGMPTIGPVE
jgi:LysM repeat protein